MKRSRPDILIGNRWLDISFPAFCMSSIQCQWIGEVVIWISSQVYIELRDADGTHSKILQECEYYCWAAVSSKCLLNTSISVFGRRWCLKRVHSINHRCIYGAWDILQTAGTWVTEWHQVSWIRGWWWDHDMEMLSTSLALCEENPLTGHRRISLTKGQYYGALVVVLHSMIWTKWQSMASLIIVCFK